MAQSKADSATPLVEVKQVTKRFFHEGRELQILKPIDLVIERGEMLCIVGASGAGKSTLLHLIGTLDALRDNLRRREPVDPFLNLDQRAAYLEQLSGSGPGDRVTLRLAVELCTLGTKCR